MNATKPVFRGSPVYIRSDGEMMLDADDDLVKHLSLRLGVEVGVVNEAFQRVTETSGESDGRDLRALVERLEKWVAKYS